MYVRFRFFSQQLLNFSQYLLPVRAYTICKNGKDNGLIDQLKSAIPFLLWHPDVVKQFGSCNVIIITIIAMRDRKTNMSQKIQYLTSFDFLIIFHTVFHIISDVSNYFLLSLRYNIHPTIIVLKFHSMVYNKNTFRLCTKSKEKSENSALRKI